MEARGSEFDLRREHFFYRVKYRVEHTFFWNRTILLNDIWYLFNHIVKAI